MLVPCVLFVAMTHGRSAHAFLHLPSLDVFDQLGNSLAIYGLVQADVVIRMVLGKDAWSLSLTRLGVGRGIKSSKFLANIACCNGAYLAVVARTSR